jgi:2,3-bisphosphoglycerate-independent phosphoglycerate mutase
MINFANPDMVGHTGDLQAAIQAVESVDIQLGHLIATVQKQKGLES